MVKLRPILLACASILCAAAHARAAVSNAEDLSACKLPNGISIIPAPHTPAAANGDLLKISTGAMTSLPAPTPGQDPALAIDQLRAAKTADLQYLPDNDGTFWAVSGAISDLGFIYLSEAAAMKVDPPMEIRGNTRTPAGMLQGISEGHTYLLKTADAKYALLRVLEKSPSGIVIQYVYQPVGSLVFDVPLGEKVKYQRPGTFAANSAGTAPATTMQATVASTNPAEITLFTGPAIPPPPITTLPAPLPKPPLGPGDVNEPGVIRLLSTSPTPAAAAAADSDMDSFAKQRDQLIKQRLAILNAPAQSPAEIERKAQAISDLGALHADEAADLLVKQIAFLYTGSHPKEFSKEAFYPSISALHQLGKPATAAALKGLKELDLDAPGEGLDSPAFSAELLAQVVRSVEGNELGDYLLQQAQQKETDPKRRALYDHLLTKTPTP